jgi:hypothetical protein
MKITSARAKEIEAYISDNPNQEEKHQRVPVQVSGRIEYLHVYRIPLELLVFNIRNGRFAAELIAKEAELKRKLDARKKDDALIIRSLLLNQSLSETEALTEDLKTHGQMEPGVATFDGAVINANRRMAILSQLHDDSGDDKFAYLKVGILPKNVSQRDLWKIEAGIQFAKDFKLEYGPINELLKLREGTEQGLSSKDISKSLLGRFTPADVQGKLEILKLVESYLVFIEKPGEFNRVQEERHVEKFNSLHNNVVRPLGREGVSKPDIAKLTQVAFSLIESGDKLTHWDIRKLKDIALFPKAKDELVSSYNFKEPRKTSIPSLVESFKAAREMVDDKAEKDKPHRLLKKALSALQSIDRKPAHFKDAAVRDLVTEIRKEVESIAKLAKV